MYMCMHMPDCVCVHHNCAGAHEGHKETIRSSGAGVTECGELVAVWVGAGKRTLKNKMLSPAEQSLQRLWIGFYPPPMDLSVLKKQSFFFFLFLSFIN